eukprot:2273256-Pyramimonas_sp.AAC.1
MCGKISRAAHPILACLPYCRTLQLRPGMQLPEGPFPIAKGVAHFARRACTELYAHIFDFTILSRS